MKKRIVSGILALALLGSIAVCADTSYTDINQDDYLLYDGVMYATHKGIINGIGNNLFNPQGILTTAEAIKLSACIHASFHNVDDLKPYTDSAHWADAYYDYAISNNIIKEGDFSKADFDNPIIRKDLFYIFANTLPEEEYPEMNYVENAPEQPSTDYIKKLFCAGIVIGDGHSFAENETITRADSAIMVFRMTVHTRRRPAFDEYIQEAVDNK